jgi:hypothetical protein
VPATQGGIELSPVHKDIFSWARENSRNELEQFSARYGSAEVGRIREEIREGMEFRIAFPIDAIEKIAASGEIKNQFQLRSQATSKGYLGNKKGDSRDKWETVLSGGKLQETPSYIQTPRRSYLRPEDANLRPVYGYVTWGEMFEKGVGQYGPVRLVLKKDLVKERVTFTMGDSSGIRGVTQINTYATPDRLVEEYIHDYSNRDLSSPPELKLDKTLLQVFHSKRGGYVEAQYYGGVKLDRDVAYIEVERGNTSLERVRALAAKYNLEVREVQWQRNY